MKFDERQLKIILDLMEKEAKKRGAPVFEKTKVIDKNPFKVFVFAFLSSRTKDKTTIEVCKKLFSVAKSFDDLLKIDVKKLESLLYGVGFYKQKARNLKKSAEIIVRKYSGKVPESLADLVSLPGVGVKIAKVILAELYSKNTIAVDVHVHRISNRLGIVRTKTPRETDKELDEIVPERLKNRYNRIFVAFGQTVCKPKNPDCEHCPLSKICPKIGIKK